MAKLRPEQARQFLESIAPTESKGGMEAFAEAGSEVAEIAAPHATPLERAEAKKVAQKVVLGEELSHDDQFALEAIIIPDKRPAVDILDGDFRIVHPLWTHFDTDQAIKNNIKRVIPSIGRIELEGHPSLPYGGTGFVVGRDLLMTNRHVAEIFGSGLGVRELTFRPGISAGIDFKRERGGGASTVVQVRAIEMIHPYWDMALLRVEGLDPRSPPLVLSLVNPEDRIGKDIAVIGYPAFDPRNDAEVQNKVFGGVYYIKRLQPGQLKAHRPVKSFGKEVVAATHDSSTLGGNSGSAVIDVSTGQIIALHFAGVYLDANFAVPTFELARDGRVIDAGVNFDKGAQGQPTIWDNWWRRLPGNEAAAPATANGPDLQSPAARTSAGGVDVGSVRSLQTGDSASWTVPIEISIRVGIAQGSLTAAATAVAPVATEAMVQPTHDEDYSTREGYKSDFLGVEVPLPTVTDTKIVARMKNGEHVISYHHFSLVMHKQRRLSIFTGANVDASPKAKAPDPKKKFTRKELGGLGDSDMEQWFPDPRISPLHQLSDKFFTKDQGAFDKGHIVRREDVAWGRTFKEVQFANGDTFHITNCSPQIAEFNRSKSEENWGDLEKFVSQQAKTERLSLFAGPVLAKNDQTFVGVDGKGVLRVKIPSRFWKVIVAANGNDLQAFAFILTQDLSDVPLEFVVDTTWQRHMISIEKLEKLLGVVRFPNAVRKADQAGTSHGESVRSSAGVEMAGPIEQDAPVAATG